MLELETTYRRAHARKTNHNHAFRVRCLHARHPSCFLPIAGSVEARKGVEECEALRSVVEGSSWRCVLWRNAKPFLRITFHRSERESSWFTFTVWRPRPDPMQPLSRPFTPQLHTTHGS